MCLYLFTCYEVLNFGNVKYLLFTGPMADTWHWLVFSRHCLSNAEVRHQNRKTLQNIYVISLKYPLPKAWHAVHIPYYTYYSQYGGLSLNFYYNSTSNPSSATSDIIQCTAEHFTLFNITRGFLLLSFRLVPWYSEVL